MLKVLIAEDEEAMLEIFGDVIEDLGYSVTRARNGEEALLLAQADVPDLVVSDQMMPVRSGLELLRALRALPATASVPFLLISAAQPKGLEEADHFLPKPFDLDVFEAAVKRTLGLRRAARAEGGPSAPGVPVATGGTVKEEILNWVAHELKTPLASARLNAELLLRQLSTRPAEAGNEQRRAEAVMGQLDRMTALVESILDAARLMEGRVASRKAPVDVPQLVVDLATRWRQQHPELQLSVSGTETPWVGTLDAVQVTTILDNLVSNALKHGGQGKPVTVTLLRTPSSLVINVRDEGPGIAAVELPRLFDRFYRGTTAGQGHGLGLYIAASLARLQGGVLSVESTLGQGSTFRLLLPKRA